MSAPRSDGHPSTSSEPSVTSSHTLHSRTSATYVDNGEGSSQRLSEDSIDVHDFAHRKPRARRSGGFLLDSDFGGGPRTRGVQPHAYIEDKKGTRSSRHVSNMLRDNHRERRDATSGVSRVDSNDSQEQDHGPLRVEKLRGGLRVMPSTSHDRAPSPNAPQRQAIDPNQLVHMALNLSESRRRNLSSGQLLASQSRALSGAPREGSFSNNGAGGSLRQYLNEQRRVSRNISPMGGTTSSSRHMSTSIQRSGSMAFPGSQSFNPSAATLARRDKARAYIELRIEYLRLLDYLPPLKSDASAPGNFFVSSNSVPGSPHAQLTRVPSYANKQQELGRPYNPLQYIRNRRCRARERRMLVHASEEFGDIDHVRDWVDRVEQQSAHFGYRQADGVSLPKLHSNHETALSPSKPSKAPTGWVCTPEDLLADAHWLEQGDNKMVIEDRHGRSVFRAKEIQKQDHLQPRPSKDYSEKRRRSWVDIPGATTDPTTGDESERGSERGRKRRLLPAIRTDSSRRRYGRSPGYHSDHNSDSSDSDTDTSKRKPFGIIDAEHNTGPLALQIRNLLEQQAKVSYTQSPAVITPDTPNKWGTYNSDVHISRASKESLEVPRFSIDSANPDDHGTFKIPPIPRRQGTFSIDSLEPRSSFEDLDSTAPNTPLHAKFFPHIGSDLSPPPSRAGSEHKKSKRSKLNIFHSHEADQNRKHEHNPETRSSGSYKKHSSRQPSEELHDGSGIGTAIMAAPGAVKSLLTSRKNDSVSSLTSPVKLNRKDTLEFREPHSAVTRFLKGVKHEGSKVGEFIFRKDRQDDSDAETVSERNSVDLSTDVSLNSTRADRPVMPRMLTSNTAGSTTSKKNGRYHLELPSFRPAHEIQTDEDTSDLEHHISRQARERKKDRSPRFDRLAPPRMDIETASIVSTGSNASLRRNSTQGHMKKALTRPGGAGLALSLRDSYSSNRKRSTSRPTLDGRRHWSITDDDSHVLRRKTDANVVTQADIVRVRALFLCSGVKAKEISFRAHTPSPKTPAFLTRAAATAKRDLVTVPKAEEHVLAARILLQDLEASTDTLSNFTKTFRDATIKDLTNLVADLTSRVEVDLMPRILDGGDSAVRVVSEVSGQGPLQVKQITDDIDHMLRTRRRRMKWIRSFGWMMDFQTVFVAKGNSSSNGQSSTSPSSFGAVAAAFIPSATTAMLFVVAFTLVRHRFPKIYFPRACIGTIPEKDRTPSQSRSYWDWVHTMRVVPDKFMLYHQSLDSYLFLRFLRTLIFICVVGCCITWPTLLIVNAMGGGSSSELDRISIGNIQKSNLLYAHAIVAWVFFSFVMFTVARERLWLIGLRQTWTMSKKNANRLSSRTVLFLSAPTATLDQSNVQRFFGEDAVRVWPATKSDTLTSLVSARNAKVEELESAEMALTRSVLDNGKGKFGARNAKYDNLPGELKKSLRPTHILKTPPPVGKDVGKKVDSIDRFREQILEKETEIEKARESNETSESRGGSAAVFVEFRTQSAAQRAYQQVASADILSLTPRYTGIKPSEVIWENLSLVPARRIPQDGLALTLVIALIIFWSIPVSIVGAISNIEYLAQNFKILSFLNSLPPSLMSLLSGLVPPLLLSALSKYVPNIFRYIFIKFGEPTKTTAELKVLKWYYVFQVVQVFLVTTLSSGAAAVASQIAKDPTQLPQLLASRLPKAANSYLTYFVVQGLTSTSDNFLNYSDVLSYIFYDKFFDKTPRQKYNSYITLRGMAWGKLFPKYVNFVIIAIAYSCIAPLVLGFAAVGLCFFYISYRYMLLFTVQPKTDTKGHCYTLALQQILTGVYIAELGLIGLFGLHEATGPSIMLVILLVLTIVFTYSTNRYFAPLEQYLPADTALTSDDDDEQAPLLSAAEEGEADALRSTEHQIQRISRQTRVPTHVVSPLARFFEPHVFASHTAMKAWLRDGDFDEDDVPEYSEEELKKAYLNPAYTSKTPVVWLARDALGVSKSEIRENNNAGLEASDQGAWIDEEGELKWSVDDFDEVPVFKKGVRW
ncbi:DUF221-domain-containing protein [Dothidotthia symphoricarpi CBS 119687]|uniref:DUF221-domain-containing protein n=1 Tax=Dothidotthia symphoricarpi CBS 119687 TaxID=1392245 RepID=A0A6A6AM82_9PLEO|nr:DUF221-domain-containing protein [Dothidotthia symphoricarpi CBS 119687]KAF2132238.1 DUF221-domain-containing protein [Dothidotthia symphoricarpi CBS 119687]